MSNLARASFVVGILGLAIAAASYRQNDVQGQMAAIREVAVSQTYKAATDTLDSILKGASELVQVAKANAAGYPEDSRYNRSIVARQDRDQIVNYIEANGAYRTQTVSLVARELEQLKTAHDRVLRRGSALPLDRSNDRADALVYRRQMTLLIAVLEQSGSGQQYASLISSVGIPASDRL